VFKNRPEAPAVPTPPATPVVLAPSAPSSLKSTPAPAAVEERKPWEASPTREGEKSDGAATKPAAETEADEQRKEDEEAQRKKEEEAREAAEWVVQPEQVPGLKESGWTKEMDEMCVVPGDPSPPHRPARSLCSLDAARLQLATAAAGARALAHEARPDRHAKLAVVVAVRQAGQQGRGRRLLHRHQGADGYVVCSAREET
jgi:hypothetical protein